MLVEKVKHDFIPTLVLVPYFIVFEIGSASNYQSVEDMNGSSEDSNNQKKNRLGIQEKFHMSVVVLNIPSSHPTMILGRKSLDFILDGEFTLPGVDVLGVFVH